MKTLLITAIGGDIAQSVATIIRESRPELCLIGVDMNQRHAGAFFVDHFSLVPAASDVTYFDVLLKIMDAFDVDALLPISEQELALFVHEENVLAGRPVIHCGKSVLKAGLDKLSTFRELERQGIAVPWTFPVVSDKPKNFPCIMKPRTGSGSKFIFLIENEYDHAYYSKKYKDSIYQELLLPADQEITCAVYRTLDGRITVIQFLRELVGGLTGWAQVINNIEIHEVCYQIAETLNLRGSMNVQLRLTEKGPRIFEINPRFSSTVLMRHKLGFSDVLWVIDEIENKYIDFPEIKTGSIVARVQSAIVI